MAQAEQEAFTHLVSLIEKGALIQIEKRKNYELTYWKNSYDTLHHSHYDGESLLEALLKIKMDKE